MRLLLVCCFLLLALPTFAQSSERPDPLKPQGENLQTPPTWNVRLDRPDPNVVVGADSTADIYFVNMTPGWHITTGPRAIFYHPAATASGEYRAEALIHLFDTHGRNEAYGLIFGGQHLDGDDIAYDYFVLRNTGEFLIKRRVGTETPTIRNWTKHEAIKTHPGGENPVANRLAIEAEAEEVAFLVNDVEVARLPRSEVRTDGIVGLRLNHHLNVHVEDFRVVE